MAADTTARFFPFIAEMSTYIILEKKATPSHLQSLECLDTPVTLTSLLHDLQEVGEATWLCFLNGPFLI